MANEIKMVMATHPKMPNHSGNARGRKVHATKDGKITICNMMVEKSHHAYHDLEFRTKCKICFKQS